MPAASASGDASAASRSARSAASEPRAAATSAASDAVRSDGAPAAAVGATRAAVVAARRAVVRGGRTGRTRRGRHRGRRRQPRSRPRGAPAERSSRRGAVVARAASSRGRSSRRGPRSSRAARSSRGPVVARPRSSRGGAGGSGVRGRGLALRRGAAERRARRGDDPGGLGAHAEDAAAARRQDLEVEVVELGAERLAGEPCSASSTVLPVNSWYALMSASSPSSALTAPLAGADRLVGRGASCRRRSRIGAPLAVDLAGVASRPGSAACGRRRTRGVQPKQREHPAPAHDQVLLDDREDRRDDPVDEQAGRQERRRRRSRSAAGTASSGAGSWCSGRRPRARVRGSIIRDWTSCSPAETIGQDADPEHEAAERDREERRRLAPTLIAAEERDRSC